MDEQLKPCPFCGSDRAWPIPCKRGSQDRLYPIVRCGGCFIDVPGKNDDYSLNCKTAIDAWNTRTDHQAVIDAHVKREVEARLNRLRQKWHLGDLTSDDFSAALKGDDT